MRDALQCSFLVSGSKESDRFQGTHITSYERKDWYTDSSLDQYAENWILENARGCPFGGGGFEEVIVECTSEMSENDEKGCDTAETLELSGQLSFFHVQKDRYD